MIKYSDCSERTKRRRREEARDMLDDISGGDTQSLLDDLVEISGRRLLETLKQKLCDNPVDNTIFQTDRYCTDKSRFETKLEPCKYCPNAHFMFYIQV